MGSGKKKQTTTQTYTPPSWVSSTAQQAAGLASAYASKPYQRYSGDRVAALSGNEQAGIDLARSASGNYQADLDKGRTALDSVSTNFAEDFDAQAYMNPYIKGALDPAAREIREDAQRRRQGILGSMDASGAYGSRSALALAEADEKAFQSIGDHYAQGYSQAFDRGTALWQADQNRKITQAGSYMQMAGVQSQATDADVMRLMNTGAAQRQVEQTMKDFDYQQFVEQRDWGGKQAAYLTEVLRGLKGSYDEKQVSETVDQQSGGAFGKILGIAGTVVGAIYGGPVGASIGGSIGSAVGGAVDGGNSKGDKGGVGKN